MLVESEQVRVHGCRQLTQIIEGSNMQKEGRKEDRRELQLCVWMDMQLKIRK